jgi:uncharacterized membrane protein
MNLIQRFGRDQNGNFAVLFACAIALGAVVSAFAIDAASIYNERRTLQRSVDLAAISAARDPAGRQVMARDVLADAGLVARNVMPADLLVQQGNYSADPAIEPHLRFRPNANPINAVRVQYQQPGTLYFASHWSPSPTLAASAVASVTPQVAFSVGSRLASLDGGVVNKLLNGLLGTNVALTLVDYNGLAGARVDALAFLDALALQLGLSVGTYDDILAAKADHGQIGRALAAVLNGPSKIAAQKIGNAAGGNGKVQISKMFSLGELGKLTLGGGGRNLFTSISALELLSVSASLSDGNHQLALSVPLNIPGLLNLSVDLAVGEPPQGGSWYAVGPTGTVTRTAQVRLRINAKLQLSLLLLPLLEVNLPLYLDVAYAEAIASAASCPTGTNRSGSATIMARPGVARLILGEVNASSFGAFNTTPTIGTAVLINLLGIKVTGVAHADIAQTTPVALNFSPSEIAANTVKTAKTRTPTGSLVGSLLGELELTAIGIPIGIIGPALAALLAPLTPALDATISSLLDTLGLSLGEADVQVYGVRCTHPVLVG